MGAADLDWQGWLVVSTLAVAFVFMGADKIGPDIVFTVLVGFYTAAGVLSTREASAGYSNTGLLTVIFLYLVSEGIYQTGGLEGVITRVLGRSRSPFWALVRMMIPTMILSAFLNNTPVVALLTPILISWARRSGVPAKKLLIPLSYASVLGGTCTLIGTSTNLVVSGAQQERYSRLQQIESVEFKIFDIAPYGVPYAIWGFLFIILTQKWLLPGNSSKFHSDLLLALRVVYGSPVKGKSILDAGLRGLHGAIVVGLLRKGVWFKDPAPHLVLEEGDSVYFAGEFDQVEYWGEEHSMQLVSHESEPGFVAPEYIEQTTCAGGYNKLVQATVVAGGPLEGLRISSAKLRSTYDCAVLGVGRGGGRADGRFSDVVLRGGDVLVLDVGARGDVGSKTFKTAFTDVHALKTGASKEFILGLRVTSGAMAGKTIGGAGLRGIPGISALALDKAADAAQRVMPIGHDVQLQTGDILWLGADLEGVAFLIKLPGLELDQQDHVNKTGVNVLYQQLTQAVVAPQGGLVGHSAKDLRLRHKYRAAVVAIHREGARHPLSASTEVLQPGDVLLLSASDEWAETHRADRNFTLMNKVPKSNPPKKNRATIAIILGIAMVATQIIPGIMGNQEWINLWPSSVLTAAVMLALGCMSGNNARAAIQWDVYLAIAGAFGVSRAMELTGVAKEFAQLFVSIANSIGGQGAGLTAIYVATALLSEILTNNAAGAIMYPIAAIAGDQLGIEPRALSIAIMLGGSAGFINPFSYQCNMMVYTAGNYRTIEFAKVGAPFQAFLLVIAGFVLCFYNSWQTVWIISFCVAGGIIGIPALWAALPPRLALEIEEQAASAADTVLSLLCLRRDRAGHRAIPASASMAELSGRADSVMGDPEGVQSSGSSLAEDQMNGKKAPSMAHLALDGTMLADLQRPLSRTLDGASGSGSGSGSGSRSAAGGSSGTR